MTEESTENNVPTEEQVSSLEEELQSKLDLAETNSKENLEKAQRAMAELDNTRKRMEKEVQNIKKYSIEKFVKELIPVLDSLEQAVEATKQEQESNKLVNEGVALTLKMLLDTFQNFSIKKIDPIGEAFDPNCHEAMSTIEDENVESGTITNVYQNGYSIHDRVIRPARVVVSK